jgi:hypothetical protein
MQTKKERNMHDELGEPLPQSVQVEMVAASLRADTTDLNTFMEALATKLAGALPNQTEVIRHHGLFSRDHSVEQIAISLGDAQYRIARDRRNILSTSRAKIVRGIVLKTDEISMDQWIQELATNLSQEAARSEGARIALERFLL